MGLDAMIFFFECWVLSQLFHSPLWFFIKRLFSSSSLSAIRVASSAYHCCLSHQGSPSWTIKKTERRKMDAFKLWCWRRLFRVPWTARRSSQYILKEIGPEYSLEGMMLKLKLQYFGHLMRRTDSLEKILKLGKIEGEKRRRQKRMKWLDTDSMDMSLSGLRELVLDREAWHAVVHEITKSQTRLSDWTELRRIYLWKHELWSQLVEFSLWL